MKVLVTGATGNVGSYAVKHLLKKGAEVRAADIDIEKSKTKFGNSSECVLFDFTKPETFAGAIEGVDTVFIMRPPHLGDPQDIKPFIEALREYGKIKLVCFLSLIGIERNPISPHYKIEKYIEKAGLPYCHIRPSFFMQNISGIHAFEIKHFNRIVVPVKKALTSFIDAEDIGEISAVVLANPEEHLNRGYSITGAEALDYYQVEEILSEELGREIKYANPKPKDAKKYWINVRGLDKGYSKVMGLLYMMTRFGTAKKVTTTFRDVVGKEPTRFSEFVKKNIDCWR